MRRRGDYFYTSETVDVDVQISKDDVLEEFSTDELIDELTQRSDRYDYGVNFDEYGSLKDYIGQYLNININAYTDEELFKVLKENWDKK